MKTQTLIQKLRYKGWPLSRIAEELDVSRTYVYKVIQEQSIKDETKAGQVRAKIKEILLS